MRNIKWIALLTMIVVIVVGISVKNRKSEEKVSPKEMVKSEWEMLSELIPKDQPVIDKIYNYSIEESNNKIKFNIGKNNIEMEKTKDGYETNFKVKQGNKVVFSKKYPESLTSAAKISLNQKEMLMATYFSGGAHCCTTARIYKTDDNNIEEGDELYLGNIDISAGEDLFIKDDKLYFLSYDDRFAYFEMDYASSHTMFYPTFIEIDTNSREFFDVSDEFKDVYIKLYDRAKQETTDIINENNCKESEVEKYQYLGQIVKRYVLGYYAGASRDYLKKELKKDFWCFPNMNFDKTESEIYKMIGE